MWTALWLFPLNLAALAFGVRMYHRSTSPVGREYVWWTRKENWFTRLFMTYFAAGDAILADLPALRAPSERTERHEGQHIDDQHLFGGWLFLVLYFLVASPWGWIRGAGAYQGNWFEARAHCTEHGYPPVGFWRWFKNPKNWTERRIQGYALLSR